MNKGKVVIEVVDGQQRLRTIFDFLEGKLKISKSQNPEFGNLTFQELPKEPKQKLLAYQLPVSVLVGVNDMEVLDVFSRLNQYSAILSSQELLEARFPGAFKQTVSKLRLDHLEFWKRNEILSEKMIARKGDAELTAELIVAMIDGLQDGKKSVAKFYEKFNDSFPLAEETISKFRSTIDLIAFVFGDGLCDTVFKRSSLFYSLFCVFFDCKYGLPRMDMGRIPVNEKTKTSILKGLNTISENNKYKRHEPKYEEFEQTLATSSNRLREREFRHRFIWNVLNSAVNEKSG